MYRFQTRSCYGCQPLAEIYRQIDNGETDHLRINCQNQLLNHLVRNMLATKTDDAALLNRTSLGEAIRHLQSFTITGLTSRLNETAASMQRVFPFIGGDCELHHANSSPRNNRCGPNGTHLELGSHPDEETRQLILAHNALDMELYQAAVEQFELQQQVLDEMD